MPAHKTLPETLRNALDEDRPIETISVPTGPVEPVELRNFTTVGTYSYCTGQEPVLLIPSAPVVARVRLPAKVVPDKGPMLVDGNGPKFPSHPLEPAIHTAALLSTSAVDFAALDFVLDRNTLRKLFGIIKGQNIGYRAFRIDGELVSNTVVLTRTEADMWDHFPGYKGCSESFRRSQSVPVTGLEEADLGGASWRISKLDLGPFTFLLRYECDAQTAVHARSDPNTEAPVTVPNLADLLAATSPSTLPTEPHPFPGSASLSYRVTSVMIPPQESLITIKTRRAHQKYDPPASVYWDQLYFSQTSRLWFALHEQHGKDPHAFFSEPYFKKHELNKGELKEYAETEGKDTVARVVVMLAAMKEVVAREGNKGLGVSFVFEPDTEGLMVWKTKEDHRRVLSEGAKALFA